MCEDFYPNAKDVLRKATEETSVRSRDLGKVILCPFTIICDENEGAPYLFKSILLRRGKKNHPVEINTKRKALWCVGRSQYGAGLADYTIEGHEEDIQIERKSAEDLFSTLAHNRENFEAEVKSLNERCQFACIVAEIDWFKIKMWKGHGASPQSVVGTRLAWEQRYPRVHWKFLPSRSDAESVVFHMLDRFWRDKHGDY